MKRVSLCILWSMVVVSVILPVYAPDGSVVVLVMRSPLLTSNMT